MAIQKKTQIRPQRKKPRMEQLELIPIPERTVPRLTGADDYRNITNIFLGRNTVDYPLSEEEDPEYQELMRQIAAMPDVRED